MSSSYGIFDVSRVKVWAYSESSGHGRMHVQNIDLYDKDDNRIGEISLFLDHPGAAIPAGDLEQLDKAE